MTNPLLETSCTHFLPVNVKLWKTPLLVCFFLFSWSRGLPTSMCCSLGEPQLPIPTHWFSSFLYLPIHLSQQQQSQLTTGVPLLRAPLYSPISLISPLYCITQIHIHAAVPMFHIYQQRLPIPSENPPKAISFSQALMKHPQTTSSTTVPSHKAPQPLTTAIPPRGGQAQPSAVALPSEAE